MSICPARMSLLVMSRATLDRTKPIDSRDIYRVVTIAEFLKVVVLRSTDD
jgi:hypothetical protein